MACKVNQKDYLAVVEDEKTGLFHGAVYRYHPTPSGCERWLLGLTTSKGYESERQAAAAINQAFPGLKQLDISTFPNDDISSISIPKGAEITLITPHNLKNKPFVEIHERGAWGKLLPIDVSYKQFMRLVRRGIIYLDSSSGDDPELSARYDHYFVAAG